VVTRSRLEASELRSRLEALGAVVVALPVITIEEPPDGGAALAVAADRLVAGAYAWVAVTSANGASRLLDTLAGRSVPAHVRWAAVGPGTAAALSAAGIGVDLVPDDIRASGLADAFPTSTGGAGTVLFPRAETVSGALVAGLGDKGWMVDEVVAYRTAPGDPEPADVQAAIEAEAIAFTSSSTVARVVELVGMERVPATIVSIGPVTSEAVRRAGLEVRAEASPHTLGGLVDAVVVALDGGLPRGAASGPTRRARWWTALDARGMRPFWVTATVVLGVQLIGLVAYSAYLFHRFDLTDDFATYAQAWWAIGHGHLDPVNTIQIPNAPFWQSHFELAMWPLATIGRVWPNPFPLLIWQDIALVASEWIALAWVGAVCADRLGRARLPAALAAVVFLVVNPWWYLTASFDVHFETLGLPFVVGTAYALWSGKSRTALVVMVVGLLFGDVTAVALVFVGLAGLASPRIRTRTRGGWKVPMAVAAVSAAWVVGITLLGANRGSGIVTNYGYLVAAPPTASTGWVVAHLATHPGHALRLFVHRLRGIGRVIASGGVLGVLTPWGLALSIGILLPASLNVNQAFLSPAIAFQTLAVIPFVFVGTVMVLVAVAGRRQADRPAHAVHSNGRGPGVLAMAFAVAVVTLSLAQNAPLLSTVRTAWWRVDAPGAATLRRALAATPVTDEAIVSQGVIGRFAGRTFLYPLVASPQAFPVRTPQVTFVIVPDQGIESIPPSLSEAAITSLTHRLHAHVVLEDHGVAVFTWRPPPGVHSIVLP